MSLFPLPLSPYSCYSFPLISLSISPFLFFLSAFLPLSSLFFMSDVFLVFVPFAFYQLFLILFCFSLFPRLSSVIVQGLFDFLPISPHFLRLSFFHISFFLFSSLFIPSSYPFHLRRIFLLPSFLHLPSSIILFMAGESPSFTNYFMNIPNLQQRFTHIYLANIRSFMKFSERL